MFLTLLLYARQTNEDEGIVRCRKTQHHQSGSNLHSLCMFDRLLVQTAMRCMYPVN